MLIDSCTSDMLVLARNGFSIGDRVLSHESFFFWDFYLKFANKKNFFKFLSLPLSYFNINLNEFIKAK